MIRIEEILKNILDINATFSGQELTLNSSLCWLFH